MTFLSDDAHAILSKRYYLRDAVGNVVEDWSDLVERVATIHAPIGKWMADLRFLPNSPTLMNAGTGMGTLSACFVLPLEDTMEGIMDAAKDQAMVQKFGGGTGFALSRLRPKGDSIATTHGVACGPVAVLRHLSSVSKLVTQGGKRDGANMAVLRVDHPDILEFIDCKLREGDIHNFNISVGITDAFMRAAIVGADYDLINPRNGEVVKRLSANGVWDKIILGAWRNGEPGVVFLDQTNREHRRLRLPEIEATNPCGEQALLGNESCNLGSIAVNRFVKEDGSDFDYSTLAACVRDAIMFLDKVIDANVYATVDIERATKATRKVGLGVMGWADALVDLGIRYGSEESFRLASKLSKFIRETAEQTSKEIEGCFSNDWKPCEEGHKGGPFEGRRNACVTTIAPTGTISMIAGVSSGIEPIFRTRFTKQNILEGRSFEYVHPKADSPFMVTADAVTVEEHVRMQAAFQDNVDSGVSKTINLPSNATEEDVEEAYMLAWQLGCKGITVYRDKSREKEVLTESPSGQHDIFPVDWDKVVRNVGDSIQLTQELTHAEGCSEQNVNYAEGCVKCEECGVAAC